LPATLAAIVPPGDLLASDKLNKTFDSNPLSGFPRGIIVLLDDGTGQNAWFAASDFEHPLQ
jgi:hypothetical protein